MLRALLQLLGVGVVLGASCSFSPDGLDVEAANGGTAPPAMPAGARPSGEGESSGGQPNAAVMRVHDVEAKRLSVRVLFAHQLEAKNGSFASSGPPLPAAELSSQLGSRDVEEPELVVDVLYAHDVKAQDVAVGELHVADVKLGEKGESEKD